MPRPTAPRVVRFVAHRRRCGGGVGIDWHGHRDRGLGGRQLAGGARSRRDRLHGAALGIGERVGNTPMDLLLVNLVLMGCIDRDLSALVEYCEAVSRASGVPIPPNYPVVGRDAFRTATGVHAAAVIKAYRKKDQALWTPSIPAFRRAWSVASRRSRSVRCPASRTSSTGWRSAGCR